ncbi:41105_t:CDS:2 [Gigaspora margarita]|uniref:41105_t:CDS:1 n=1 Tax=Gigaspora margarita TaxID=4874 RepID=A0ABN7X0F0_GIGMA|nr:41105_t:CDS:2 [Gigaspora margarita]
MQEQLQHEAKQIRNLDEMWGIKAWDKGKAPAISALSYYEDILAQSKRQIQRIEEHYNELKNQLRSLQNAKNKLAKSQPYKVITKWEKKYVRQKKLQILYGRIFAIQNICLVALEDESKLVVYTWLCSIPPKDRSPLVLKKKLKTNIFPKLLGVPIIISESTTRKFMHL